MKKKNEVMAPSDRLQESEQPGGLTHSTEQVWQLENTKIPPPFCDAGACRSAEPESSHHDSVSRQKIRDATLIKGGKYAVNRHF